MSVRLTKKKQKQMLTDLDAIIMRHRVRIYQQLTDRVNQSTADSIQTILGEMNAEVVQAMGKHFADLLASEAPGLPFRA